MSIDNKMQMIGQGIGKLNDDKMRRGESAFQMMSQGAQPLLDSFAREDQQSHESNMQEQGAKDQQEQIALMQELASMYPMFAEWFKYGPEPYNQGRE